MRARRLGVGLALACAALVACKDAAKQPPPPVPAPPAPAPAATDTPKPSLPAEAVAEAKAAPKEPVTVEQVAALLPKVEGTAIIPLKQTSNHAQVHGTWCIDGDGADAVARLVGRWMAESRYTAISIRGDARKAGVSGDRDGLRMSMVVSASGAASCAAPKHYFASATFFRP